MEKVKKIWFNGEFVDWEKAKVHILTHTLHYGGGVFEGIRAYKTEQGPAVFRLKDHIKRLFYSAGALEMEIPFSPQELEEAVLGLIKINKIEECYIRPIVVFGYGKMGLNPLGAPVNVFIILWPWKAYLGNEPLKVKVSKYIRIHPKSTVADAKICGHYVNSILASLEAQKAGFKEALFLDFEGFVAEGPGENIFMVKENKLFTPSAGSILPGITRDTIFSIAQDLSIEAEEKKIVLEEIKNADEAFFAGTAVEVCPIGQIDEALIGNGDMGEITRRVKSLYQDIVCGKKEKYLKWLSYVKS